MDFNWFDEIPWMKKVKNFVNVRHRAGDIFYWLPKTGIVAKPRGRKPGISVYMSVKNEAQWIEPTLKSLAPFVEQFSIVDNGSSDNTVDIIRRVAEEISLDYVLELHPDADFGEARDHALKNTTCHWILRWDGDIITRSQGNDTFKKIRDFAMSLDQECFYAIYFPHAQLDGDLFHQDPVRPIHHEDYLITFSPLLYHTHIGRMRELRYPFYYKRIYLWTPASFHLWGIGKPEFMVQRTYLEEWRKLNDFDTWPTVTSYAEFCTKRDYATDSLTEAGALYVRERLRDHVPYDSEKYGDYPYYLKPYFDNFPLRIIYRNGVIAGRSDVMDTLDRLDSEKKQTSVDVIIPTRNREEFTTATVEKLLEQDYPDYHIIVNDQSDIPSELLRELSDKHERFQYYIAVSRGLPASRNEALSYSSADIVIFVDDDVIPEPGFIIGHVLAYKNETIGGVAGKIIDRRPAMMKLLPREKVGKVNYWTGGVSRGFIVDCFLDVDTAPGGNMSFRRTVLEKSGGFDIRFRGNALLEETDASLGVRKLGYTIRYTPDAMLTHLAASTGGCRLPDVSFDVYWYAHNSMLLYLKYFPWYTFPVWFMIRAAKFIRDSIRTFRPAPLIQGFKGLYDGCMSYRKKQNGLSAVE